MAENWEMQAMMHDDARVVESLLNAGANINIRFEDDYSTPLHISAHYRNRNNVEALLKHNADPNLANSLGFTPLHFAVGDNEFIPNPYTHPNQLPIVRMLLKKGADVNARNIQLETTLMIAAEGFNLDVIQVLLEAGADVCSRDRQNRNCLHHLFYHSGKTNMMRELVMAGASPLARNNSGKDAFDAIMDSDNHSRRQKFEEVTELIKMVTLVKDNNLNFRFVYRLRRFADECHGEVRRMRIFILSRRWTLRDFALHGKGQNSQKIVDLAFENLMEHKFSIYNDYLVSHFDKNYLVVKLMEGGIIVHTRTGRTYVKLCDHLIPDFCEFLTKTDICNLLKVNFISEDARKNRDRKI